MSKRKTRLTPRENKALAEFAGRVRQTLRKNLASMRLFGSKARGDSRKDSDVDVLVSVHRLSSEIKSRVIDIAFDIDLEYGVNISPRVVSHRIFSARVWRITPFVKNIKEEGILL